MVKWFIHQNLSEDENNTTLNSPRRNFFTSPLDVFTGLNTNAVWNVGVHIEYRSNTINGLNLLTPFEFNDRHNKEWDLHELLQL